MASVRGLAISSSSYSYSGATARGEPLSLSLCDCVELRLLRIVRNHGGTTSARRAWDRVPPLKSRRIVLNIRTGVFITSKSHILASQLTAGSCCRNFGLGDGRIGKVEMRRAAVSTKQEETAVKVEQGGGGGIGGPNDGGGGGGGGGGDAVDWISSALIFGFWAGLLFYGVTMSPNQTPYRDTYFIEKLVGLHGEDGFAMNKVLIAEFYIMGVWPLVYTSLLIPSGRSSKGVPVGPFAALSTFVGAFALLPYFGLWRPPPPQVRKDDLNRWPLSVLESKITSVVAIVSTIVLLGFAGLAGGDQWVEFAQYFRESRFIHMMSIDCLTLTTLAPFWVYNDLAVRKGSDSTSSLWALAFLPVLGPSIYLLLRPPIPDKIIESSAKENDESSS